MQSSPLWLREYARDFLERFAPATRGGRVSTRVTERGVNAYAMYDVLMPFTDHLLCSGERSVYISRCSDSRPVPEMLHEFGERHVALRNVEEIEAAEQSFREADRRREMTEWGNWLSGRKRTYGPM